MTYDVRDGYVVLWDGYHTWGYTNGAWFEFRPVASPPHVWGNALAYDASDGYVLLFASGYASGSASGVSQTWAFSQGNWTDLTATVSGPPPLRYSFSMTYDTRDGYVLLFGGVGLVGPGLLGDTWSYVHSRWTRLAPVVSPSPRGSAALVYDSADGYVLLWGGQVPSCTPSCDLVGLTDTWKFAGGQWTSLTGLSASAPGPISDGGNYGLIAPAADDPSDHGVVLLASTYQGTWTYGGTWLFRSGVWRENPAVGSPGPAVDPAAAGMIHEPGASSEFMFTEWPTSASWRVAQGNWTQAGSTPATAPPSRDLFALTYEARDQEVVLFGGGNGSTLYGDTWAYARGQWQALHPAVSPPARDQAAMAYDSQDGYVVLFGGCGAIRCPLGDTWSFANGNWMDLTSAASSAPSPRFLASMTDDPSTGGVVLFGGGDNGAKFGDTWSFRGGHWAQLAPNGHPSPRIGANLAYDATDGYAVLFGGCGDSCPLGDTWMFSGGQWTQLSSPLSPPARHDAAFAFDARDGHLLLFGGCGIALCPLGDTWGFVRGAWTRLAPTAFPSPRDDAAMTFDGTTNLTMLLDGCAQAACSVNDTWFYRGGELLQVSLSWEGAPGSSSLTLSAQASGGVPPYTFQWAQVPGGCAAVNSTQLRCPASAAFGSAGAILVRDATSAVTERSFRVAVPTGSQDWMVGLATLVAVGGYMAVTSLVAAGGVGAVLVARQWRSYRQREREEVLRELLEPPAGRP